MGSSLLRWVLELALRRSPGKVYSGGSLDAKDFLVLLRKEAGYAGDVDEIGDSSGLFLIGRGRCGAHDRRA
jgi:hypothetical protein